MGCLSEQPVLSKNSNSNSLNSNKSYYSWRQTDTSTVFNSSHHFCNSIYNSCESNYDADIEGLDPNVEIYEFENGESYTGFIKDGKFHGKWVYIFSNGDAYEGEWRDSKANGSGKLSN